MIVEDGDIVMIHGRYVGWAEKPLVAVDIFRVRDGKLVEHWDVMQEEVPVSATVSGNPMFTIPVNASNRDRGARFHSQDALDAAPLQHRTERETEG